MYYTPPQLYPVNMQYSIYKHVFTKWKTVWILISWLCEKPADQDIHCFLKRLYPGSAGQCLSGLLIKFGNLIIYNMKNGSILAQW